MSKDHLHITSFIEPELWEAAKWLGVAYLLTESDKDIPVIGLVFEHEHPALEIFSGWIGRLGREDEYEQLRLSIVEGDIPGKDAGYSVVVSSDVEGILAYAQTRDIDFEPQHFAFIGRWLRMPAGTGPYSLQVFKDRFRRYNRFALVPVIYNSGDVEPHYDRGIEKTRIYFRHSSEVSHADPDAFIYL